MHVQTLGPEVLRQEQGVAPDGRLCMVHDRGIREAAERELVSVQHGFEE
jgi:hypothetical protein